MKYRLLSLIISAMLLLTGCAPDIIQADKTEQIYASFYPIYALSSLVLDDIPGIRLKCLIQPQDDCLRLYELSDWDASALAYDTDCVIIGGNGLESFENSLYTFGENGAAVINSTYSTELYDHTANQSTSNNTGHFTGLNPHAYMSVYCAEEMIKTICGSLAELYPDKAEQFNNNLAKAILEFTKLQEHVETLARVFNGQPIILMNEALVYVAEDYGLEISYIYDRESATTLYGNNLETALSAFSDAGTDIIFIEKQAPAELVRALEDAGFKLVLLDIMSSGDINGSGSYIETQYKNADRLVKVLTAFGSEE